jgi:hypothetical protein
VVSESFRIGTAGDEMTGPARWIRVVVHPDVADMHRLARRRSPWSPPEDETRGMFQPAPVREWYDAELKEWVRRWPASYAGIMRLARGWVTSEIVAHELMHAACAIYRMSVCALIRLEDDCGRREESLAYIYGQLFAGFQHEWEAIA